MPMSDNLYDRPELYDLISPPDPAMERFYVEEALEGARNVLELACGTGRFTVPMALAGATVVGADLSWAMLYRARTLARERTAAVEFLELDMRKFDLGGRKFDTIIVAANSILHLHTADEFAGFFRSVRRHLLPDGRLVFDAFVPSVAMLARNPAERHLVERMEHPTLGTITLEETTRYNPLTQISYIDWYWSTATERDRWHTPLAMRQIFPEEMPLLLSSGGFRLVDRYGDFDRSPLIPSRFRQVCIAQRV
jgi:SAM-dependent methyltransferase